MTGKKSREFRPETPTLGWIPTLDRRRFLGVSAMGLSGLAAGVARGQQSAPPPAATPGQVATNVAAVRDVPRTRWSMPGRFPGRVARVNTGAACRDGAVAPEAAREAVAAGLLALTGERDPARAWRLFVSPDDVVGIKLNPIGGVLLSNRLEVVDAIVEGLVSAGLERTRIVIWDRRLFQLHDAGFTPDRFPGVQIMGTEVKGPNGEFYDEENRLWSRENVDPDSPAYVADLEGTYNRDTIPYMVNEGTHSYFTRLVTRLCTKIINVPVLKNAGNSVTLCLKNLSFGSLSNTARLHAIWARAVSEPCAFPCLRDKVVLNIVDGLRACYDGGPGANPSFIYDANLMLFGTDAVAVDAVGYEIVLAERIARGVVQADHPRGREFLRIAAELGLGTADRPAITVTEAALGPAVWVPRQGRSEAKSCLSAEPASPDLHSAAAFSSSRLRRAMLVMEMRLGQTASHSRWFEQAPKPS